MAEGSGKPIASASVRITADGVDKVRADLKGVAAETKVTGEAMGEAADKAAAVGEEIKVVGEKAKDAGDKVKDAGDKGGKSIREMGNEAQKTVSQFTKLVGAASAVAAAFIAVVNAGKEVSKFYKFLTESNEALNRIIKENGGLVPQTSGEAQRQLAEVRDRLQEVGAEMAFVAEKGSILERATSRPIGVFAVDAVVNGIGRTTEAIGEENDALRKQEASLVRIADAIAKREATQARQTANVQLEASLISEMEQRQLALLDDPVDQVNAVYDLERRRIMEMRGLADEANRERLDAVLGLIEAQREKEIQAIADRKAAEEAADQQREAREEQAGRDRDQREENASRERERREIESAQRAARAMADAMIRELERARATGSQGLDVATSGSNVEAAIRLDSLNRQNQATDISVMP